MNNEENSDSCLIALEISSRTLQNFVSACNTSFKMLKPPHNETVSAMVVETLSFFSKAVMDSVEMYAFAETEIGKEDMSNTIPPLEHLDECFQDELENLDDIQELLEEEDNISDEDAK